MTLREQAEKEAAVAILDFETSRDPAPDGLLKSCIADAIERVAKGFADRSLRHVMSAYRHPNMPTHIATAIIPKRNGLFGLGYSTLAQAQEHVDWAITEIIAATERGE